MIVPPQLAALEAQAAGSPIVTQCFKLGLIRVSCFGAAAISRRSSRHRSHRWRRKREWCTRSWRHFGWLWQRAERAIRHFFLEQGQRTSCIQVRWALDEHHRADILPKTLDKMSQKVEWVNSIQIRC